MNARAGETHWSREQGRTVFAGRVTLREHDVVLPDGSASRYLVDESIESAVAVLVRLSHDEILLCRQYRFAIDRWIYDLPGGAVDANESPGDAARRECEEEVGIIPVSLAPLATFFVNPGRAAWPVHLYFCDVFRKGTQISSDASEQVRIERMRIDQVDRLIADGTIVDPSLLIAFASARRKGLLDD